MLKNIMEIAMKTLNGRVLSPVTNANGATVGYNIEVEENGSKKTYYAHLGDLKNNEDYLYNCPDTMYLKENETVQFEPWEPNKPRAIRVRKI